MIDPIPRHLAGDLTGGDPAPDDFALAARSTPLARFVLDAIDAAGGRITFERFMALALGHPEHGYYSRAGLAWGRDGDYETSPEVHPIFGYLWARQVEQCWERLGRPDRFALVEPGAGSGAFAVAILTWLRARAPACFAATRPVILDGHPRRVAEQRAALAAAGFAAEHALIDEWLSQPQRVTGVIISNEYFDALPVHLVERRGDASAEWVEWYVARAADHVDGLAFVAGPPSTPQIAAHFARLGLLPGDGARTEVGLAAIEAMRRLAAKLERGYLVTIDYGYAARDLYAPWRREGTLMAFRRHSPQPDPLAAPGRTDLTAHVDLTALAAAAGEGWHTAPPVTQAEALTVLGLPEALRAAAAGAAADALRFVTDRRAVAVLTDPAGLGRIRVLVMAKDAPLDGLRCLRAIEATYASDGAARGDERPEM
ncbi:MAG: SAM-dependent methyltransferase [Dehalococcoidia bacterium]|nr:SAM-dependent methyltransferase [Dehalococcoidia bacterium]